jgi:DNA polymerase-3 subunit alpha
MLQNTLENHAKKLTLQLDIHQLDDTKVETLQSHLKQFKGDKSLFFCIYDSEKKIKLTLNSKKQKVQISPALLEALALEDWYYKLN